MLVNSDVNRRPNRTKCLRMLASLGGGHGDVELGSGVGETVGVGAGFEDVAAEGETVDDGGA